MKPELLHILQHSLGVDQYGRGSLYRNHFVTGPGSKDFPLCRELVGLGFMVDHGPQRGMRDDHAFQVTEAGTRAMYEASPREPKVSRSRSRYHRFLDADTGMTFREWLGIKPKRRAI